MPDPREWLTRTHCSRCKQRISWSPVWNWIGHTWECSRIAKEPDTSYREEHARVYP